MPDQTPTNGLADHSLRRARLLVDTDRLLGLDLTLIAAPPAKVPSPAASQPPPAPSPSLPKSSASSAKSALLDEIRARHDAQCPHCTTATYHQRTVFGEGDPDARLMFVGEAPGEEEDKTGRPFVGRAGQLLDKMITAMGLSRSAVYIANILKSRPPNNATPTPIEVARCSPYLAEQIRIIRPEVIVALGAPSAKFLLQTEEGINKLRGQWWTTKVAGPDLEPIPVMPTYHPAYLLRAYTPENRAKVWGDLQQAMQRLGLNAKS